MQTKRVNRWRAGLRSQARRARRGDTLGELRRQMLIASRPLAPPAWVSAGDAWYVLEAEARREKRAEAELIGARFDAWLPRVAVTVAYRGRFRSLERALFPGYLLLSIEDLAAFRPAELEAIDGVRGIVSELTRAGRRPSRLPSGFVLELLERMRRGGGEVEFALPHARVPAVPGAEVRIIGGPFAGFLGVVEQTLPGLAAMTVRAQLFGRETRMRVSLAQVARM